MADFEAELVHGNNVTMADHTPGGAIAAGDVTVVGHVPMICHDAIPASKLGALAIGGGVYRMVPDAAIAAGQPVWWDGAEVTETATANEHFGFTVAASYDSDGLVDVMHAPQALTGPIV